MDSPLRFAAIIARVLEEHPDWLQHAISGVVKGMELAQERMYKKLERKDRAFLAALSLTHTNRLTQDLREELNNIICEAINPDMASSKEQESLKLQKGGQK